MLVRADPGKKRVRFLESPVVAVWLKRRLWYLCCRLKLLSLLATVLLEGSDSDSIENLQVTLPMTFPLPMSTDIVFFCFPFDFLSSCL